MPPRLKFAVALVLAAVALWFAVDLLLGDDRPQVDKPGPSSPTQGARPDDGSAAQPLQRTEVAVPHPDVLAVQGRVLDAYGEPLASALVGDAESDRPVTSGRDGRFELTFPADTRTFRLLVLARDHAPHSSTHEPNGRGATFDVGDLQLSSGGGLRGQVRAGGAPFAGAHVRLEPRGQALPATVDFDLLRPPVVTGDDGGYAFANLNAGSYRVHAGAPGMQDALPVTVDVRDGTIVEVAPIELAAGVAVTLTVRGPVGEPVAGAEVTLRSIHRQTRHNSRWTTGDDGRVAMTKLPPEVLQIEVRKVGYLPHQGTVQPVKQPDSTITLDAGLQITGHVVDARSGAAVERFATTVRRIGDLDPPRNGTIEQQLRRQIAALQATATEGGSGQQELARQFEERLANFTRMAGARPVIVPAGMAAPAQHAGGRFAVDGLEEGLYAVGVASPEHQFVQIEPVEVRRALPATELRFVLPKGISLQGVVVAERGGGAIAAAAVELVKVTSAPTEPSEVQRSLYPWLFAPPAPTGVTVMQATTDGGGAFTFQNVPAGEYALAIHHAKFTDRDVAPFALHADRRELRVTMVAMASLTGTVRRLPANGEGADVLVLGGHGVMRTMHAGKDGQYRCDDLPPGKYLVRAFPRSADRYVRRLLGDLFPLHAGAVQPDKVPPADVELAPGAEVHFDPQLDVPATGVVTGSATRNGAPCHEGSAVLRPVPGEAPGAGGLSLSCPFDAAGTFAIRDVPVGNYQLALLGRTRQELHRAAVTVTAEPAAPLQIELAAGGIRGRVAVDDGTPATELNGYLWVLHGVAEAPPDLYEFRRSNRAHRLAVRDGAYADPDLTAGTALLILDLRGRARTERSATIPVAGMLDLDVSAGPRQQ